MKVAIASDDNKTITGHIGRVRGFIIIQVEGGEVKLKEYRPNVFTRHGRTENGEEHGHHGEGHGHGHHHNEEHGHGHGHENLAEGLKDCSHLICTGAGWRVVEDLKSLGVEVVFTNETDAEQAAVKFEKGELEMNVDGTCHAH